MIIKCWQCWHVLIYTAKLHLQCHCSALLGLHASLHIYSLLTYCKMCIFRDHQIFSMLAI